MDLFLEILSTVLVVLLSIITILLMLCLLVGLGDALYHWHEWF